MNVFELFFFLLALTLSFVTGRYGWMHFGWWAAIMGAVLGLGVVPALLMLLLKIVGRRIPKAVRP